MQPPRFSTNVRTSLCIADASHELRTPLAVLRGETEVALNKPRTVAEYEDSLSLIKDEAERLSRIVEDLFMLARQPIDAPRITNTKTCRAREAVDRGREYENIIPNDSDCRPLRGLSITSLAVPGVSLRSTPEGFMPPAASRVHYLHFWRASPNASRMRRFIQLQLRH
jgi:hypothetical protein